MPISFAIRADICIATLTLFPDGANARGPPATRFVSFQPCRDSGAGVRYRLAIGAAIGLLVGASEPPRGPVPTG